MWQNFKHNNKGVTLVELIITFALMSIFMVAVTTLMASIMNVYYRVKGTESGIAVTNILTEKICGEMENAKNTPIATTDPDQVVMKVADDKVEFVNRQGSVVSISLIEKQGKKYFNENFAEISSIDAESGQKETLYNTVDWNFDESAYMGYSVSKLKFSKAGTGYPNNVLKMELEVTSDKYGEYEAVRYISCYNYDNTSKIEVN